MSTEDRHGPDGLNEDPAKAADRLQGDSQAPAPTKRSPLNLNSVTPQSRNIVPARIEIRYERFVGTSSARAADAVIQSGANCGLKNPLPAALELYPGASEERVLHGVPRDEQNNTWLNLNWYDQGRRFRASFRHLLALLKITIPNGTRMIINVAADHDPELGPCVKLWWETDCFVPIDSPDSD